MVNLDIKPTIDIQSDTARQKAITWMSQLRNSPGWKMLKKDTEAFIKALQEQINTVGLNELKYSEKDLFILQCRFVQQLIDRPDYLIELLKNEPVDDSNPHDPFED